MFYVLNNLKWYINFIGYPRKKKSNKLWAHGLEMIIDLK